MRAVDLIRKKRDSGELSREEINFLVSGYTRGDIPDYQMAAWLMAVWIRGMNRSELAALTEVMLHSGEVLNHSEILGKKSGQALHRRHWRQNLSYPRSHRGSRRPDRSYDQRPRPWPHRRHTGQAGSDYRLQCQSSARRISPRPPPMRHGPDWDDRIDCSRGQVILRTTRRHFY